MKFHTVGVDIIEKPLVVLWLVVHAFPSLDLTLEVAVEYPGGNASLRGAKLPSDLQIDVFIYLMEINGLSNPDFFCQTRRKSSRLGKDSTV